MEEPIKFIISQEIICGQDEQGVRKYKKIEGKNSIWYVALQINEADHIYVTHKNPKHNKFGSFEGFGGATLLFELEDGTVDAIKGPWHSNSDSLLEDTGYDITDKCFTRGIIATKRELDSYYYGILHYDEEPVLGKFTRITNMAQEFANNLYQDIYYAVVSTGGGSSGCKQPRV